METLFRERQRRLTRNLVEQPCRKSVIELNSLQPSILDMERRELVTLKVKIIRVLVG